MVEIMTDGELMDAIEVCGTYYTDDGRKVRAAEAVRMFTIKEAADKLKASYAQVASWLRSGRLAGIQVRGYFWRVPETALQAFVKPKRGRPKVKKQEVT
jgi:excisionase family DNA binding protein